MPIAHYGIKYHLINNIISPWFTDNYSPDPHENGPDASLTLWCHAGTARQALRPSPPGCPTPCSHSGTARPGLRQPPTGCPTLWSQQRVPTSGFRRD